MEILKRVAFFVIILTPISTSADQVASGGFKGLNNNEASVIIDPSEAQDLLNVDVTPGGKSVKKRSGFGLYKALGTGQGLHGGFHAFDSIGIDYQLWGSSSSLYSIVGDGTPVRIISSATVNATWDCTDTQGFSYCVDTSRDAFIRTDGTTMSWYTTPLGTMIEATPDRLVVAGVSGTPNTLYVSQSNTFTNFVVGNAATDAFTEPIAAPGSKITHIRWGCGKLLWWKDASFGYFDFDDQFTGQVKTVSDVIGTFDNTSAIDPGGNVWFRGQDGHTWVYDCSSLEKKSLDISPNVQLSGRRTTNLWTQTSQSDFETGAASPQGTVNTVTTPGSVATSRYVLSEGTGEQFIQGTFRNMQVNGDFVRFSSFTTTSPPNNEFNTGCPAVLSDWNPEGANCGTSPGPTGSCTITPRSGSYMMFMGNNASDGIPTLSAAVKDCVSGVGYSTFTLVWGADNCTWAARTLSQTGLAGRPVKLTFSNGYIQPLTSDCFISNGQDITFYTASGLSSQYHHFNIEDVTGGSTGLSGTGSFTSQVYDTGFPTAVYSIPTFNYSYSTAPVTFSLLTSASSNGTFTPLLSSLNTNAVGQRYAKYTATVTVTATDPGLTLISSVTVIARSTGSYLSAVKNAPNLTGWSTLGANVNLNGGSHTFYMRASTNPFTVTSATPSWTAQTEGGQITISTGTYFQVRDDFFVTAATNTPTLHDFTVNWLEGNSADQAYMLYFDDAIWQGVAFGAGQSVNNYIFKYDLINQGWTLYNIGVGGMLVQRNKLYFGETSAGNVHQFGSATSDNGTAITAYWQSKDFGGADPFLQTQLTNVDSFAKTNTGTTLTVTYAVDTSTTTSFSMSLTNNTGNFVQSRKLLPSGKLGQIFNIKYGDTSTSSAWELLGYRLGFNQLPYRSTQ